MGVEERGVGGGGDLCPPLAGEKVCVPTTGCAGSAMGVM